MNAPPLPSARHLDHLEYYERLSYDRAEVHAHHLRLQRSSALQSMADPAVVEFTSHGQYVDTPGHALVGVTARA